MSGVGRELLEWAGDLKLLVDNLQLHQKVKKKSRGIIKEKMTRAGLGNESVNNSFQ